MEYRYSHQIDPSSYDNQGLCDGIPLRTHRNTDLDEAGTIRLRKDWRKHVGPLPSVSFGGNMGPIYNFTSVALPECHPERLELVSYIMEFGFLHDDLIDISKVDEAIALNCNVHNSLSNGDSGTGKLHGSRAGEAKIVKRIIEEVSALDPGRSQALIDYWKSDFSVVRDRKDFAGLDDYLEYRVVDCGSFFLTALATFGMALDIPASETAECIRLTRPVWLAASLTNDVQSWDKECKLVALQDKKDMVNSVWILMKEHSIDVDEAKKRVLAKAREFVAEYVLTVQSIQTRQDLSLDSRKYVEAMQYMVSGNLMWGISTPRYHPEWSLTPIQIARLESDTSPEDLSPGAKKRARSTDHLTENVEPENIVVDEPGTPPTSKPRERVDSAVDLVSVGLSGLSQEVVRRPADYVTSLPSKNVRQMAISALNIWLNVPETATRQIDSIVAKLHTASLMLDDVEDRSELRRGKPSSHTVFGPAQTINSAGFRVIEAMSESRALGEVQCLDVFIEEVSSLYIGQSHDLAWTAYIDCPTVEDFLSMIDMKTSSLFRLLGRLMLAMRPSPLEADILRFLTLFGRYFQVRDDLMNLLSTEYTDLKGFCEDLDEGKISLTTIHALTVGDQEKRAVLRSLLSRRHIAGHMTPAQKQLFLQQLQDCGSFDYARNFAIKIKAEMVAQLRIIEAKSGIENCILSSLLEKLDIPSQDCLVR